LQLREDEMQLKKDQLAVEQDTAAKTNRAQVFKELIAQKTPVTEMKAIMKMYDEYTDV